MQKSRISLADYRQLAPTALRIKCHKYAEVLCAYEICFYEISEYMTIIIVCGLTIEIMLILSSKPFFQSKSSKKY